MVRELHPEHGVACHYAEELAEPTRREQLVSAAASVSSARTVGDEESVSPPPMPPAQRPGEFPSVDNASDEGPLLG